MMESRKWGGRTAEERQGERREQLIEAAIRLYGQRGYRNTTVRAVCQEAGLTERYYYESFANSQDLLAAAFGTVIRRMDARTLAGIDKSLSPFMQVRAGLTTYYGALRDHPASTRVFLLETTGVSPAMDLAFKRSLFAMTEQLLSICDPARTGPVGRSPLLHRAVAGGLLHIALAWSEAGFAQALDEVVAAALAVCALAAPDLFVSTPSEPGRPQFSSSSESQ